MLALVPPKPNEFEIIFFIDIEIDSWGIRFMKLFESGWSYWDISYL